MSWLRTGSEQETSLSLLPGSTGTLQVGGALGHLEGKTPQGLKPQALWSNLAWTVWE